MQTDEMTAADVVKMVEKYLKPHQPKSYKIKVLHKGATVDDDGWWQVLVKPSKRSAPSYDWTARCAEAAVELDEAEGVHVLLTPA
jgi:hypothetical protein